MKGLDSDYFIFTRDLLQTIALEENFNTAHELGADAMIIIDSDW